MSPDQGAQPQGFAERASGVETSSPHAPPAARERALPPAEVSLEWLATMLLIRRFEERAGEMYARAKVGGFLHLAIGEEATIVGAARALRDNDYLVSTYRSHGHALVRGTDPRNVMAELFGRVDGCSRGRGGSMHMFDAARRFMGGYGIVGGNLPIAAGIALGSDYKASDEVTLCVLGDGACNQGTFGETMNVAALWRLPIVFLVTNNQYGMGTALERHSAVTELRARGEGFGVPGLRCDGMDVLDTHGVVADALRTAREERRPTLVEAITYRYRGHSMADPERYRTKEQVAEWRKRDPIELFKTRLQEAALLDQPRYEELDREAVQTVDEAVRFADASPFPAPESLYDNVYALGDQIHGWYSVRTTELPPAAPEAPATDASTGEIPQQMTAALQSGDEATWEGAGEED
jgi:pyruvate dehydrogenase E1 component alpha subunit